MVVARLPPTLDCTGTMARSRRDCLRALIDYRLPVEVTLQELAAFGWDSPETVVILEREDVLMLLRRYLAGELSSEQVTDWADLVECREDIGFPESQAEVLSRIIFRLANPSINGSVTRELAEQIQLELGGEDSAI
jgi:hypothetical protein